MGDFKAFDGGDLFVQPEKPFLLIYESREDEVSVAWFKTEEDLMECVDEVKQGGCQIVDTIEIGSCRDIHIGYEEK